MSLSPLETTTPQRDAGIAPTRALSPRAAILARRSKQRPIKHPYAGVTLNVARGKYQAFVKIRGRRIHLGMWRHALDAAVARDRGVLFYALDERLNVATISKPLGPESPERLRWLARRKAKESKATSVYFGVARNRARACWDASICVGGGKRVRIASFADAESAATAYDRVVAWMFGDTRPLNFPDRRRVPASIEDVRSEARARPFRAKSRRSSDGAGKLDLSSCPESFALAPRAMSGAAASTRSPEVV